MDITNKSNGALVLPTGEAINAGQTISVSANTFDQEHYVLSTWIEAGMLTAERTEDDAEEKSLNRMTVAELQQYLTDNGGTFEEDDNKKTLFGNASKLEADLVKGE